MAQLEVVESPAPAAAAKPAKKMMGPALIGGGALVGLLVGGLLVGPLVAGSGGGEPAKEKKAGHAAKAEGGHGKEGGGPESVVELDNIIVNPAGAEGVHFLMVSVAFEVEDKTVQDYLRNNEHRLKDVVLSVLGSQTLETLCRPNARQELKGLLASEVNAMAGTEGAIAVFLPEFVVQ